MKAHKGMAGTHGRYKWQEQMAVTNGRHKWQVQMAGTNGRYKSTYSKHQITVSGHLDARTGLLQH